MNYRHRFHAGNFADVFKHIVFLRLIAAMQRKERGFVCVDTHAGRGRYNLDEASVGDTLARQPEHPHGIGRLEKIPDGAAPEAVAGYLRQVRSFDRDRGNLGDGVRFYPGSPWLAKRVLREQDRLVLCERHPAEAQALRVEFAGQPCVEVREADGYEAVRAVLPPREKRALVLIDPPFEDTDEFVRMAAAVGESLRRVPQAVIACWYPLTERARVDAFHAALERLAPAPLLAVELAIAGDHSPLKLRGCGMALVNPPWQFEDELDSPLQWLARELAQEPGGGAQVRWLVEEKS